jgi:excisionase family DNA binding protein
MSIRLAVPDVADKLGMSIHRVYRRIHRGDIPAAVGGPRNSQYFVDSDDLDAYIAAHSGKGLTWPAPNRPMLRAGEVAAMLGFTVETVRKLCADGKLAYHRGNGVRGHYRIPREAVEQYLASTSK